MDNLSRLPIAKQEIAVKENVFVVLEYLKKKYRLGIVSNHKVWMKDFLKDCGLAQYFETIVISDIVGVEKPDPKIMGIV